MQLCKMNLCGNAYKAVVMYKSTTVIPFGAEKPCCYLLLKNVVTEMLSLTILSDIESSCVRV